MKNIILILLLNSATNIFAKGVQLSVGIAYADISGLNAYEAGATRNANTQGTKNLIVPFIHISKNLSESFSLSYRYSYYDEITNQGEAPDSDIFNQGGISLTVVTDYQFKERIHENTFALNYSIFDNNKWVIELGPNFSVTQSKVDFFTVPQNNRKINDFSETDYSIGAELSALYNITSKMNLIFNYRYSSTGNKDINLLGLGLAYQF